MRKTLRNSLILLFFYLSTPSCYAQTHGYTITGIRGATKTMGEIVAYDKAHPRLVRPLIVRDEIEDGPKKIGMDPSAHFTTSFGSLLRHNGINRNNFITPTGISTPTQSVYSNFLAISGNESPYIPPDNNGEVGLTQIVVTANTRMKVFTKPLITGTASTTPTGTSSTVLSSIYNVDLASFFTNSSLGISSMSDPHVRFDRLTQRWFIVMIEVNHSTNNYCAIAVSNSATITDATSFTIYYFNESMTGCDPIDFYDYPTLGIDKNSLYIGGNMFANSSTFSGCNMWVVNKADLLAGTLTVTGFPHASATTDIYTPQGVNIDDPSYSEGYFIGASQTLTGRLIFKRVTYSGNVPSLSTDVPISILANAAPLTVPAKGSTPLSLDGSDDRPFAAMVKKNKIDGTYSLWTAVCSQMNASGIGGTGGTRNGAQWYQIGTLTATPTVLQSGTAFDNAASNPNYYTYPTIAMSGQGHSLMTFSTGGLGKNEQASAAGRYRTDASGTLQTLIDITNTTSAYNAQTSGATYQRWGDYTQTAIDPLDDQTIWTFSQYSANTNIWGVRAAQFKAPPPATPALATTPIRCNAASITINGTSTNNSEFFDPGADAGGPGFNRLQVSISGPSVIAVSNVTFVSTTQITATLNTVSAAAGTYTLTVTNPDGQTASTTFTLGPLVSLTATAGGPDNTCQSATPSALTLSGASVGGSAVTGSWSILSGGGSLSNTVQQNNSGIASTIYTPAANYTGTVTLRLTTNNPGDPCAATSDRTINVNPNTATAVAGGPDNTCQSATPAAITLSGASVSGAISTGSWSIISGGGTLSNSSSQNNVGIAATTYTPAANYSGTVTLRLTTDLPVNCGATIVSADRTINVNPPNTATATAGTSPLSSCSGSSSFAMTGATASGGTNAWSGGVGLGTWTQNANPALATFNPTVSAGSFTAILTSTGCGSTATAFKVISWGGPSRGLWIGVTNSNWNTTTNWCGGVIPTASTNVTIPVAAPFMPNINVAAVCNNITISNGATLTSGAFGLTVSGNWTNNGTFTGGSGIVTFAGSSAQSIGGAGTNTFGALTIANTGGGIATLNTSSTCTSLGFTATTSSPTLTLASGITLTCSGAVTMPRPAAGFLCTLNVNAGTLSCNSLTMSSTITGRNDIINISTGTLTVAGTITSGTTGCQILFSAAGTLNVGGTPTAFSSTPTLTTAVGSTVNYNGAGAQTIRTTTYSNLTLSGSGVKTTAAAVIVNAILSMQGVATTAGVIPTYGSASTLEYKGSASQTTGLEFKTPWAGTGGVAINNSNGVTLGASVTISSSLALTLGSFKVGTNTLTYSGTGNSITKTSGNIDASNASATIIFTNASALSLPTGAFTGNINNLTMNGAGGVTLGNAMTIANVLTLTSGIVTTSSVLTLNNTATTAISGTPSTTSYISGPLARALPLSLSASASVYSFPVGKGGTYYPFSMTTITTGTVTTPLITVEAFNAGSGGTGDCSTAGAVSLTEYWLTTFSGDYTNSKLSLTRQTAVNAGSVIGRSSTVAGIYSSLAGTVSGNSINSSNPTGGTLGYLAMCSASGAPTITGLGTSTGCSNSSQLTINGTNLTGATTSNVKIGGVPVASIVSNSGSVLIVVVGAIASGTVSVALSCGTATSAASYTVNSAPTSQASIAAYTSTTINGTTVNWTRGNGVGVVVVARLTATGAIDPVGLTTYTANTVFGTGAGLQLTGPSNQVVYVGTGTSVPVTGLSSSTSYTFTVYEYSATPCYLLPGSSSALIIPCALPPTAPDVTQCGPSSFLLAASSGTFASYLWYDAATSGNLVSSSATFTTPVINVSTPYYVEDVVMSAESNLAVAPVVTSAASSNSAVAYNVVNNTATALIITKVACRMNTTAVSSSFQVYYNPSGFTLANMGSATGWTQVVNTTAATTAGAETTITLTTPISIPAGATYGIYFYTNNNVVFINNTNSSASNASITINGGGWQGGLSSPFGSAGTSGTLQGHVYYKILTCESVRTNCNAIVNTSPTLTGVASSSASLCSGGTATIILAGLLSGSTNTINYTIVGTAGNQIATGVTAAAPTFSTIPLIPANSGQIITITAVTRTDVTPSCGPVSFNYTATLPIVNGVTLTGVSSSSAALCNGGSATITLSGLATGSTNTITYTVGGTAGNQIAPGVTAASPTFSTIALTTANSGQVITITAVTRTDVIPNCGPSSFNFTSSLPTVNAAPVISSPPANITGNIGSPAVFSVTATGTIISYQWQVSTDGGVTFNNISDGAVYSGTTTNSMTVTSPTLPMDGNRFRVVVNGTVACGSIISGSATLTLSFSVTWTGSISTDWSTPGNWTTGIVPNSSGAIVTIPSSPVRQPLISSGTFNIRDINIANGASLINNGTLQIAGALNNSGTFTSTSGTIALNGYVAQNIAPNTFSSNTLNGLTIANTAGVSLGGALTLINALSFGSVNSATFTTNDNLTLHSDSTSYSTARVADLTNGGVNTGNTITGNVMVERYINSFLKRAYHLLAPSVNSAASIHSNWQEGATAWYNDPNHDYGTQITGSTVDQQNGFDQTSTASASLFTINYATGWVKIANTDVLTLDSKTGYLLFVRGNRGYLLNTTPTAQPYSNTTLRAKGPLVTGNVTFTPPQIVTGVWPGGTSSTGQSLVTNPYASPLDWSLVYTEGSNSTNFYQYVNLWDPHLSGQGAYVQVDNLGNNSNFSSTLTNEIQSGSAFFIFNKVNAPASFIVKEKDKSTTANIHAYTPMVVMPKFYTSLFYNDAILGRTNADGTLAIYDNSYCACVNGDDALNSAQSGEDIAITRDGVNLSIEKRPLIVASDTLFIFMQHMKTKAYQWQFDIQNSFDPSLSAVLVDSYLGTRTPVSLAAETIVSFNTDLSVPASIAANRFYIVFTPGSPLPVTITSIRAYTVPPSGARGPGVNVDWTVSQQINMGSYEVEKSQDGRSFTHAGTVAATPTTGAAAYSFYDAIPNTGANYYRVKIIDRSSATSYTNIVSLLIGKGTPFINVYPVPIIGNTVTLQLNNIDKGSYNISITNKLGQLVYKAPLNHLGGSAAMTFTINGLTGGTYQLKVGEYVVQMIKD